MDTELAFDKKYEGLFSGTVPGTDVPYIICIDSTVLGPALGGTRFLLYASFEDAKVDVIRLARGMTYKAAMIWPDYKLGGGKAVIIGDHKQLKNPQLLMAYGNIINHLGGRYITAEDMNMNVGDIEKIRLVTPFVGGRSEVTGGSGNPAPFTTQGCIAAQRAAMQKVFKTRRYHKRRLVFQGVGEVGFRLAREAQHLGSHIVACDKEPDKVERIRSEVGAEIVDPDEIFSQQGDIFVPCAGGGILNDETIPLLQCPIVAGPANNQLADPARDGRMLMEQGIIYATDYIGNAGGVISSADELLPGGSNKERINRNIDKIYGRVEWSLEEAERQKRPPHEIADEMCRKRIELVREANELSTLKEVHV